MSRMTEAIGLKMKSTSMGVLTFSLKLFSGFMLGLTFALIGEETFSYGTFSFFFVISALTLCFLRLAKGWSWVSVLVFDLICVLLALLIRVYIMVAPGA